MRPNIFGAAIFAVCFALIFSVTPVAAYYTNMPASVVVSQVDFTHNTANQGGPVGPNTLGSGVRTGVWVDPGTGKLFIADYANRRVLIYNRVPTSNNISADVVIGQQNFTSNGNNQGGSAGPNTLALTTGVFFDASSGKLLVSDYANHRILIFNRIPTSNNASADVVIGQQNFTSISANQGGAIAANKLNFPPHAFVDAASGKLLVTDKLNNRVLVFNRIPTSNNASADVVIGQANFSGGSGNQGIGVGPNMLSGPASAVVDPSTGKLFISDVGNNRVLIYNQIPTSNNASADLVIGQVDLTHNNLGGNPAADTINGATGVAFDGGRLFVADYGNQRVLIYNQIPTGNNASADAVIGQPNFASSGFNQNGTVGANTLSMAEGQIAVAGNQLFVTDEFNSRVTIYNNDTTKAGLSISNSAQSVEGNLVKLLGNASTNVPNYTIQSVAYAVNGGGMNGATATDGAFNSPNEDFFFTFDPKSNNNTEDGYVVQVQSRTSNFDLTDHLFYFQPFNLNTPEDRSFLSKSLPTFSFSVNKQQIQLKENLSKYVVMVKKSGGDWKTYVDNIPVDYVSVKDSVDNVQKSSNSNNGNGNYEDKKILVVYSNNNSSITVTPKAADDQGNANSLSFDQNGKLLSNGGYEWKVQAIDKNGHTQETETRKFVVGASSFGNGSNWFPLQVNSISGLGRVYLSTINPQLIKPKYRVQTSNPIFKGISNANSTVQLDLTNHTCLTKGESSCTQTFTTNANGASQFSLATSTNTLKTGNIYQAQFSVSQNGLFNALPPFLVTR